MCNSLHTAASVSQRFTAGGDAFTVTGVSLARNAALIGFGLDWHVAKRADVTVCYEGLFGGHAHDSVAVASLNWRS